MAIFWLFYLGLVHQVYSDTSSDDLTRCPSRCDTLKELDTLRMDINVLRQLLNQESIIRMNLEEKIQNQQKLIDDMAKEINFVNRSTEEIILETRKLHSEVQEMVGNQSVSSLDTQTNISSLWNSLRTQGQEIHDVNSETKANMSSLWNSVKTQGLEIRDLQTEGNRTIAFTVSTSIILRNYNNKIIKYDKVLTNKGSAYNTNTGIFTCPTTGTYVFTWSTMSGVYSNICDATIYHNGNGLLLSSSNEGGGSYEEVASNTLVLTMAVGDRVWIQTGTGTFCNGYPWTGFSGWKI